MGIEGRVEKKAATIEGLPKYMLADLSLIPYTDCGGALQENVRKLRRDIESLNA